MNCEHAKALIDPYTTNELDLASALEIEQHLGECVACSSELEALRALRNTISAGSLRFSAPPDLRAELSNQPRRLSRGRFQLLAVAAAIAVLLILPWTVLYWSSASSPQNQLAQEVATAHIRSLMGDHLLDVPSTDQHTVKPWFNGKLEFSPSVVDLKSDGFPLIGGRLDYIDHHAVAAIVYQRHKHLINLFTWPSAASDNSPVSSQHNGYNLVRWTRQNMMFVAISDLNQEELRHFANLLTTTPATRASDH